MFLEMMETTGGGQKKVATHKKWVTWFIYDGLPGYLVLYGLPGSINEENVNKTYVFVLAQVPVGKYKH